MEIELRTRDQEFVAIVDLPMFKLLPQVVQWGERVFAQDPKEVINVRRPVYSEVFMAVSLTPSPGKPKDY